MPRSSRILRGGADQVGAVEQDLAGDLRCAALVQPHDRQAGDTLAGAGLADYAERRARHRERQPVDGLHHAVIGREVHAQVADLQERFAHLFLTLRSTGVQQVDDQVRDHDEECRDQHHAEDLRQVVLLDAVDRVLAQAVQRERLLGEHRAPPSSRPTSRPKMVTIGVSAPRGRG